MAINRSVANDTNHFLGSLTAPGTEPERPTPKSVRARRAYKSLVPPQAAVIEEAKDVTYFLGDGRLAYAGDQSFIRATKAFSEFTGWIHSNYSQHAMAWLLFRTACTMRNMLHRMDFNNASHWLSAYSDLLRHRYDVADSVKDQGLFGAIYTGIFDPRRRDEQKLSKFNQGIGLSNIDADGE